MELIGTNYLPWKMVKSEAAVQQPQVPTRIKVAGYETYVGKHLGAG
jgi:hypothetical protein